MATDIKIPTIVILGPTASGKTSVAIELAQKAAGEIICADSRTVYKGLNIGTAKPTLSEMRGVPHHLLDVIEPNEIFSAAQFQARARETIDEIKKRNRIPVVVGGSGLYLDGLLFDYQFGHKADLQMRASLENMSEAELLEYCNKNNIELPNNIHNKRYMIRAIEQNGINHKRKSSPLKEFLIVGITTEKELLRTRISRRAQQMFLHGLLPEAAKAAKVYGWEAPALQMPAYQLAHRVLNKEISIEEAIRRLTQSDARLAKKQLTWFRRNEYITWLPLDRVYSYIAHVVVPLNH